MVTNIAEIHEHVLSFLLSNHPDLTFALRSNNEEESLDKRLWLYGTHNQVFVSFWNLWDEYTPCINFCIDLERQECALSMQITPIDRANEKDSTLIQNIAEFVDAKQYNGRLHWIKKYEVLDIENKNYLTYLEDFIQKDKRKIDKVFELSGKEYLFDKKEFDDNLEKIAAYNNDEAITSIIQPKHLLIQQLKLENVKIFADVSINFSPNLTCFIGENGTGKSTILQALAFATISRRFHTADNHFELRTFIKLPKSGVLTIEDQQKQAKIGLISAEKHYTYTTNTNIDLYNQVEYFGQNAWIDNDYRKADNLHQLVLGFAQNPKIVSQQQNYQKPYPNISEVQNFILQNSNNNAFKNFENWLLEHFKHNKRNAQISDVASRIFDIIKAITQNDFDIISREDEILLKNIKNQQILPLHLLSDGEKNVLGWVGHFMKRLWETWDEWYESRKIAERKTAFWEHPALVLIDEIDTYLHPQWQCTIMAVLVKNFPNVQFVITTHSPYVVGSIPKDKIKIYTCEKTENEVKVTAFTDFTAFGADIKELSARLYGNIERPVREIQTIFETLFEDIEIFENNPNDGILEEKIRGIIAELTRKIHHADPDLLRAKGLLEMILTLNQMEKEGV